LRVKSSTLAAARDSFTVEGYLQTKGAAIAEAESGTKSKLLTPKVERGSGGTATNGGAALNGTIGASGAAAAKGAESTEGGAEDILNPRLFELLREWRYALAVEQGVPAYVVATQKALTGIANALPSTPSQLGAIKGIGPVFIEKYGTKVLSIIEEYRTGKIG